MAREITVEKRLPILGTDALVELSSLGVKIGDGSGRIFVSLEIPEDNEKKALRILRREGFAPAGEGRRLDEIQHRAEARKQTKE
jgi:hypothetical protein